MTAEKIQKVLDIYERRLLKDERERGLKDGPNHVLEMIPLTREFVIHGRTEKAFRWLGFMQGVLWMSGYYTIDEMKQHNMPEGETFEASA